MAEVTANGCRFNVMHLGDGAETVVCIHGLLLDNLSSFYYTIAPGLAQHAEVYMYDLRGHGRTERTPDGYGVDTGVTDLCALLDELGVAGPVHLVGNSFGGFIALRMAIDHPERVASLVLVEAHYAVAGWGDQMVESLTTATANADGAGPANQPEGPGRRRSKRFARHAQALVGETSLLGELREVQPVSEEELMGIGCPVLAFYGGESGLAERGRDLERLVPDCELHVLPEASHFALFEAGPLVEHLFLGRLGVETPKPHASPT